MKYLLSILSVLSIQASNSFAQSTDNKDYPVHGHFESVGAKQTSGDIVIHNKLGKLHLRLAANFATQMGPDLRVVLRDSKGITPMVIVDALRGFTGEQEYELALSADDLKNFDQVVIYCAKFHVDFGIAQLQ